MDVSLLTRAHDLLPLLAKWRPRCHRYTDTKPLRVRGRRTVHQTGRRVHPDTFDAAERLCWIREQREEIRQANEMSLSLKIDFFSCTCPAQAKESSGVNCVGAVIERGEKKIPSGDKKQAECCALWEVILLRLFALISFYSRKKKNLLWGSGRKYSSCAFAWSPPPTFFFQTVLSLKKNSVTGTSWERPFHFH